MQTSSLSEKHIIYNKSGEVITQVSIAEILHLQLKYFLFTSFRQQAAFLR